VIPLICYCRSLLFWLRFEISSGAHDNSKLQTLAFELSKGICVTANTATRPLKSRHRLLHHGPSHLSDAELLIVLLGLDARGSLALEQMANLLDASGGLCALLRQNSRDLKRGGLGAARIARLYAAVELGRRYIEAPARRLQTLACPQDAARCFKARLADLSYEVFACIFLDTRHRIIRYEALFRGTIDGATVHPREVVKRALDLDAAAVIAGHNHPSGDCEPSEADRNITLKLKESLGLLDIRLLDHLIVSRSGHASLAERGWL